MEQIVLKVDESASEKWRSASVKLKTELTRLIEKQIINLIDMSKDSYSLPGNALSLKAFKEWILEAESSDTINITDAKGQWTKKREQLEKLTH